MHGREKGRGARGRSFLGEKLRDGSDKACNSTALEEERRTWGQSRREGRGEVPHVKSFKQIKGSIVTPAFAPLEKE